MDTVITLSQLGGFLAAAILITLAPGPDNLLVLSLGIAQGRRAGIAFGLGCALGCLSHTALAALGVSALIAATPAAFAALKLCSGLYLIWLGIQALRHARPLGAPPAAADGTGLRHLFGKGLIANAINPKVILFFLAFLPQFVDNRTGAAGWQIAQLGMVFTVQAMAIFSAIGWFAGRLGQSLARRPGLGAWLDRGAGGLFVALGIRLLTDR